MCASRHRNEARRRGLSRRFPPRGARRRLPDSDRCRHRGKVELMARSRRPRATPPKCALTPALRRDILAAVPRLRAFAVSLTASTDRADDLVQETMVRALAHIEQFQPGTNLRAWLFTILRNQFNSEYRQRRWTTEDSDGIYVDSLKVMPGQGSWLEFQELRLALTKLPPEQREAIVLVGASGMTYEEAASICGCAIGTIKSRVRSEEQTSELQSLRHLVCRLLLEKKKKR